jgi:hypothetical protein
MAQTDPLVVVEGQPLDSLERTLDGGPVDRQAGGQLGQAGLGCLAARRRDEPNDRRLTGEPAVGIEHRDRIEVTTGGADRTLEICRLRVQDPIQLATERSRHLTGLDLKERPAGPDAPQEGADGLPVLRGDDAPAAADAPRHRQADVGKSRGEDRRLGRIDHELEVRSPAREAERPPSQEAAARPRDPAMVGGTPPLERRRTPAVAEPPEADREPGDGGFTASPHRAKAGRLGGPVAWSGGVDRRELIAKPPDKVPFRARHVGTPVFMPTGSMCGGGSRTPVRGRG